MARSQKQQKLCGLQALHSKAIREGDLLSGRAPYPKEIGHVLRQIRPCMPSI